MSRKLTPMMKQYLEVKDQHPDKIVFFRMGDFFEMFFDDAKTASQVLGVALTSRDKGKDPVPMAGIPHHSSEQYLKRLVDAGYKVVICDQVEDASEAVGLVRRAVTRIVTPGTYFNEETGDLKGNVFLASLFHNGREAGISVVDLSTGEFFAEKMNKRDAVEEVLKLGVTECLVPEGNDAEYADAVRELSDERVTRVPAWNFDMKTSLSLLREHFSVASLRGFGFEDEETDISLRAAGAVLQYLRETQKNDLRHIIKLTPLLDKHVLQIDRATQYNLELIRTQKSRDTSGSLYSVLNYTRTAPGGRKLKHFILRPVTDCMEIFRRQEAVREFSEDDFLREEIREVMTGIQDMERIISKVASGRCNARDLVGLRQSLEGVRSLKESLSGVWSDRLGNVCERLDQDGFLIDYLKKRIVDEPPLALTETGVIREGVDAELDDLRNIMKNGKQYIADYQKKERDRTGIEKMRVGYNKVFGYYIEITNSYKDRVPDDYIRKQTLKGSERYITPELKEYEDKVLSAEERVRKLEYAIFQETREQVSLRIEEVLELASAAAELDVYQSLGMAAYTHGYHAPVVDESLSLEIHGGCHPVLHQSMASGSFVPNDLFMNGGESQFLIITGPNMAGKSTYIRQAAILVLMAQMGSFIPAEKAKIGVVDRLFTRIGASDEISRGQSTFMVEMTEVANILNNATERSFVILDEVGRGTSTFDGVSIAWAIAEHMIDTIRARTLFATHYHEMTELEMTHSAVKNLNVSIKEWDGKVIFLHKVIEGTADKSYGIHVADIAGLPDAVISRASEVLENLELSSVGENNMPSLAKTKEPSSEPVQLSIFDMHNDKVLKRIRELDLNGMTPLDALNILDSLKKELG